MAALDHNRCGLSTSSYFVGSILCYGVAPPHVKVPFETVIQQLHNNAGAAVSPVTTTDKLSSGFVSIVRHRTCTIPKTNAAVGNKPGRPLVHWVS